MTKKELEREIRKKESQINEPTKKEDNSYVYSNLWVKRHEKEKERKNQQGIKNKCFRDIAKKLKEDEPHIVKTSYNKQDVEKQVDNALNAEMLSEQQVSEFRKTISTQEQKAENISINRVDYSELLDEVNNILATKVKAKEVISEFSGENKNEKIEFAKKGLEIHSPQDRCAFCGSPITEERYKKVKRYFDVDEVEELKNRIDRETKYVTTVLDDLDKIVMSTYEFYPKYRSKVDGLINVINKEISDLKVILNNIRNALEKKQSNLFIESDNLQIELHDQLNQKIDEYNELVSENNQINLDKEKNDYKSKLELHELKSQLQKFNYQDIKDKLDKLNLEYKAIEEEIGEIEKEIDDTEKEVQIIDEKIVKLKQKTENEALLAKRINERLALYADFQLELRKQGDNEYYQIKSLVTQELRDVVQLSTGEQNLIAFLYFIQKLGEIDYSERSKKPKLIVFDDPMSSNDDMMQYLMIEELEALIDKLNSKENNDASFMIFTHNKHFYINLIYKHSSLKDEPHYHLQSNGINTTIKKIESSDQEFRTGYDSLWEELGFLYSAAPKPAMLLNTIRRIIETYTKFNCIEITDMYKNIWGAKKLFDVNSHSIDDMEAELNGQTKVNIMSLMGKCFRNVNGVSHFEMYLERYFSDKDISLIKS